MPWQGVHPFGRYLRNSGSSSFPAKVCAEKKDAYFLVDLAFKYLLRRTQRDKAAGIPI